MINRTIVSKINDSTPIQVNSLTDFLNLEQEWLKILNLEPKSESKELKRAEVLAKAIDSCLVKNFLSACNSKK